MSLLCPEMRECPSTKTVSMDNLLAAYAHQNAQWPNIRKAYFEEHWSQKQKMKRFVKDRRRWGMMWRRLLGRATRRLRRMWWWRTVMGMWEATCEASHRSWAAPWQRRWDNQPALCTWMSSVPRWIARLAMKRCSRPKSSEWSVAVTILALGRTGIETSMPQSIFWICFWNCAMLALEIINLQDKIKGIDELILLRLFE